MHKHSRFGTGRRRRPEPADERPIDEVALLRRLAAGWPVWRIAAHYRTTTDEIRQVIGAAVSRGVLEDPQFGLPVDD